MDTRVIVNVRNDLAAGYSSRPADMQDLEACVALMNVAFRELKGVDLFSCEDIGQDWQTPGFNLETDTRLVITPDGEIAGYYELWDLLQPSVRVNIWGLTHPNHHNCGIGTYLLDWAEERAWLAVERAPAAARVVIQSNVPTINPVAGKLFANCGYRLIRHSLRMVIEMNGIPPRPQWPAGLAVRTFKAGSDEVKVVQAIRDSFKDHWGYIDTPFEEEFERWKHRIEKSPDFNPSLWFLAVDGEEIAGISLCREKFYDDPDMGWVSTLGVRRPWRRKGLGLALLHHSFRELYRLGKLRVGLGVDAQSLTGATRLYQKAGMRPDPTRQYDLYEKELRPGIELSTQTVQQ